MNRESTNQNIIENGATNTNEIQEVVIENI